MISSLAKENEESKIVSLSLSLCRVEEKEKRKAGREILSDVIIQLPLLSSDRYL